jgi:serine/threonine protein kinase
MGTVAYMSPEQARGEELDARTDIFSLGAVLYEMATGKPAFPGRTSAIVFKSILDGTPTPPSRLAPSLPFQLDQMVAKALEKDRNLRYQTAADLRTDLSRLQRDSDSRRLTAVTAPKRNWLRFFVVTAMVVILVITGTAYWYLNRPPKLAENDASVLANFLNHTGWRRLMGKPAVPQIHSPAVLPLQNLSPDPGQEYFSDGMTDALITDLAQLGSLKVISRTSSMQYNRPGSPCRRSRVTSMWTGSSKARYSAQETECESPHNWFTVQQTGTYGPIATSETSMTSLHWNGT